MSNFKEVISFESLYRAHLRARLGKRGKKEVILFEQNLSDNIIKLHYDLLYKRYKVSGYHSFMIYDPKEREIQTISYIDRVVQHSICDNYLMPLLEKRLIYDNTACRKNKGTDFAIKRLRKFMTDNYKKNKNNGYFVKVDISKYFNNIDHDVLKNILSKVITDKDILNLLFLIIDSYNFDTNKGLPMGNQTSQCFALLYLDSIDRVVKEELGIKHYVRYMDDIIIITNNKDNAKKCLDVINENVNKKNLTLNYKSQIIKTKNGINFLGYHFYYTGSGKIIQKIKKENKKRLIKKVKHKIKIKDSLLNKNFSLNSYKGFIKRGNYYLYKKVEKMYKNC